MELIQVYGCDHCSMVSRRKGSVSRHEFSFCKKNPNRTTCLNCKQMDYEEGSAEPLDSGQTIYHPHSYYCLARDINLDGNNLNDNIACEMHAIKKV